MKEKTVFAIGLFNVIRLYCLPFFYRDWLGQFRPYSETVLNDNKKVFLKIPQNLQENTSARVSFLIKLQVVA